MRLGAALEVAKLGVASYPSSARLLCRLGDLIQLAGDESDALDDALACYERAALADPTLGEALTSIGYFYDVHTQDMAAAERAFRRALGYADDEDTVVGLARVMAQRGYDRDAIHELLDRAPDQGAARVVMMRTEVDSGEWEPVSDSAMPN